MTRKMTWLVLLVALALAVGQISFAQAAPLQQTSVVDVTSVTPITDPDLNVTGYIVQYTDGTGDHTVVLTVDEAIAWGLVDSSGNLLVTLPYVGLVIPVASPDPCTSSGTGQPVGEALTGVFCGSQGVSYDTIMGWQTSGYGFGVIAQALFMAQTLGGDPTLAAAILAAKTSGDYSGLAAWLTAIGVEDPSTVTNWGQLKKALMAYEVANMTNLGAVMSGRQGALPVPTTAAPVITTTTTNTSTNPGNGKGKAKGQNGGGPGHNGNGNANGKNKGN
jgi:hypothetical protein